MMKKFFGARNCGRSIAGMVSKMEHGVKGGVGQWH